MRNKGVSAMKEYMIVKVQFNVSSMEFPRVV